MFDGSMWTDRQKEWKYIIACFIVMSQQKVWLFYYSNDFWSDHQVHKHSSSKQKKIIVVQLHTNATEMHASLQW